MNILPLPIQGNEKKCWGIFKPGHQDELLCDINELWRLIFINQLITEPAMKLIAIMMMIPAQSVNKTDWSRVDEKWKKT